jgi:hypothetical protein
MGSGTQGQVGTETLGTGDLQGKWYSLGSEEAPKAEFGVQVQVLNVLGSVALPESPHPHPENHTNTGFSAPRLPRGAWP